MTHAKSATIPAVKFPAITFRHDLVRTMAAEFRKALPLLGEPEPPADAAFRVERNNFANTFVVGLFSFDDADGVRRTLRMSYKDGAVAVVDRDVPAQVHRDRRLCVRP